jgi:methionyl-tRNA formyltransferase
MIFVGNGALLWRAVAHAKAAGQPVDLVVTGPGAPHRDPAAVDTHDVNAVARDIDAASSDGIIWSIDNAFVFRAPVLELDQRIYNVHGGPLPAYRGLPLATVAHALLNDEPEYGATLHQVDAGLDTGPVIDECRFPIAPDDVFEDVMLATIDACHELFVDNLDDVAAGRCTPRPQPDGPSGYYGLHAARQLHRHRDNPRYARATDLGLFADFYPEAAAAWS